MNKTKLVRNILISYYGEAASESIAKEIVDTLDEAMLTNKRVSEIRKAKDDLAETHKKILKEKDLELQAFQKMCKHPLTNYYPDPSGNNDSYTECDICGAEV